MNWKLCHYGDEGGPALIIFKEGFFFPLLPFFFLFSFFPQKRSKDPGEINGEAFPPS